MHDRDLYATILGIGAPWKVVDVDISAKAEQVRVVIRSAPDYRHPCPRCKQPSPGYDTRVRRWRHLDTCQFRTIVEADVPRVECSKHGVLQIEVPWAEPGSNFTALMEALVIDWLKEASILAVARRIRLTWDEVSGIMERAVRRGLARRKHRTPVRIGVDETSFQKRHEYVTIVSDQRSGVVLYVADDRRSESLEGYLKSLSTEDIASIEAVAMDMCPAYISAVERLIPGARLKVCFDKFHVAKHLGDAVDRVRRRENRELLAQDDRRLVKTKYLWLRRAESLMEDALKFVRRMKSAALATARAWAFKERAMALWRFATRGWLATAWNSWVAGALRSRLEPVKRVAATIRDHLWGIINAITLNVTNATAESINAKVQRIKRMACGFRNRERFKNAILFHLGGLDLTPSTHPQA